ncbi:MAG: D-glycero-alpha-D-manno-heptose-1,7-bisphosphate 7-phosphatase [Candidatus Acidiferrales bacterium]
MVNPVTRRRAVFLDRDGTIAEENGYVNHIGRFDIFPFAAAAIRRLNDLRWPVIVVTNQSGVARGFFPEEMVHRVNQKMMAQLAQGGAHVDAIYYCPHIREDGCTCRKPLPGMLEQAARELGLEWTGSFLVSDRFVDLQMGARAGCRNILVKTGYGRGEYEWNRSRWTDLQYQPVDDLTEAVDWILEDTR